MLELKINMQVIALIYNKSVVFVFYSYLYGIVSKVDTGYNAG